MKPTLNLTTQQVEELKKAFYQSLTDRQKAWDSYRKKGERDIYKCFERQIGVTWYLSRIALIEALEAGEDYFYLTFNATHARCMQDELLHYVKEQTGVAVKGHNIVLNNGACLRFLSKDSKPLAGYSGNVIIDEILTGQEEKKILTLARTIAYHGNHHITMVRS